MKSKLSGKNFILILLSLIVLITAIFGGGGFATAFAETSYSGVLQDLQKDESFNVEQYPEDSKDYSIKVIQVAESTDGELLIYTYQPCQKLHYLIATNINMSRSENIGSNVDGAVGGAVSGAVGGVTGGLISGATGGSNNLSVTQLYSLTLVNSDGVLCKYKVNDFTVSNDEIRYYNITSIYREWIKGIDGESLTDNEIKKVSFAVRQLWTAKNVEGKVVYTMSETDVVVINNAWNGTIRYIDGFTGGGIFFDNDTDSHFVAFSCDHEIDELKSADVFYKYRSVYHRDPLIGDNRYDYGEEISDTVTVKPYKVTVKDGFKKHEWNRIERVSDFISNEDLTDETKHNLDGKQWVLRFFETGYDSFQEESFTEWYTEVTACTILRLEFEYQGETYNLGAVDNVRKPDSEPDNNKNAGGYSFFGRIWEALKRFFTGQSSWWVYVIVGVVTLAFLLPILGYFIPVFGKVLLVILKAIWTGIKWLFKGLWWLICLPFKGIAALIRKRKAKKSTGGSKKNHKSKKSKRTA